MKHKTIRFCRRAAIFTLAVLLFLPLAACGKKDAADEPASNPGFYVYDPAEVLDGALEEYIIAQNDALFALTGAQVVIACVDTTGHQDTGHYAESLFNSWGIGSAEKNNGVLLLLTIDEQDYWCIQGVGLENTLSSGTLKLMLNQYLEPDFAAARYADGVRRIFDAIIAHLEAVYSVQLESWDGTAGNYTPANKEDEEKVPQPEQRRTSGGILIWAVVIVLIIVIVIAMKGSGNSGGGSRQQQGRTVYTAPRTRPTSYGTSMPRQQSRPTYRPPSGGSYGASRPSSTSRPSGSYGASRPSSTSRPSGSYGASRPSSTSRPSGSYGASRPGGTSRPSGSYGASRPSSTPRSGGGGFTRGGGAGRR